MNDLQRIQRAKSRLQKGWCQGAPALALHEGRLFAVLPEHPAACQWCLLGALELHDYSEWVKYPEMFEKLIELIEADLPRRKYYTTPGVVLAQWNDSPTRRQEEVLSVIDRLEALYHG
jgi:hypothetical protein